MVEAVAEVAAAAAHTRQETQLVAHGTHVLVRAVRVVIPAGKNALLQTVAALVHHLVKELAQLLASHQRKKTATLVVLVIIPALLVILVIIPALLVILHLLPPQAAAALRRHR